MHPLSVLALAALISTGCTTYRSDMKAFCDAPASMPRQKGETSEQYVERVFLTATPKLTNAEAISSVGSLGNVEASQKPNLLRENARAANAGECALADLWEWELILDEQRPRPAEGVRLLFSQAARTSADAITIAREARVGIDALGLKDTRVVTARCRQGFWACVAVETAAADQTKEIEAVLAGIKVDLTPGLQLVESRPIHAGTISL